MESMTGYGRAALMEDGREVTIELKSVNHRFLDLAFRAPKTLSFLEEPLRSLLKKSGIGRGHVEISITYQNRREDAATVEIDMRLLEGFAKAVEQCSVLHAAAPLTAAQLLELSGAVTTQQAEEDTEAVTALAAKVAAAAADQLLQMRRTEGQALLNDLLTNLSSLSALREEIALRAPEVPKEYRRRLEARLQEWAVETVEPQRIAQEVATMADRCAIDEELSRLKSHIEQFCTTAKTASEAGKKLDFLLQEMNREVNTIGSKASDASITDRVVAMKCIVEKLREQVQNVA